jgi:uncharacterized protein DUF4242
MPRYLVERTFPNGLAIPVTDPGAQACQSVVTTNAEDGVTWIHSYVTPDRKQTFCVYDAPAPEPIRRGRAQQAARRPHHRGPRARSVLLSLRIKEPPMKAFDSVLLGLITVTLTSCSSAGMATHDASASSPLAQEVRGATERYQDVSAATGAGYALFLGCVTSPQGGAMGIHYVNGDLVGDGKLDASRPEALMYEPKDGKLDLVGVEYIDTSPNRYGIPAYYSLHVWAWRHNPTGVFGDWNPKVSCDGYTAQAAAPSAADARK